MLARIFVPLHLDLKTDIVMIRKYILSIIAATFFAIMSAAQPNIRLADLPLSLSPDQMVEQLQQKGMHLVMGAGLTDTYRLTGKLAGLNVYVDVNYAKDSLHINHLRLSTHKAARTILEDYTTVMRWMEKHYGKPTWESTVRSHPFARWYIGFDCDIVLIATAKSTIEVYFYNNHQKRNIDYYAILKYCERNPVDTAPHLTARESVTWRSSSAPVVKKKPSKRHLRKKASKSRRKSKARKSRKRRR